MRKMPFSFEKLAADTAALQATSKHSKEALTNLGELVRVLARPGLTDAYNEVVLLQARFRARLEELADLIEDETRFWDDGK